MNKTILAAAMAGLALAGCNNDDSTVNGVLLDSPVEGVTWTTSGGKSGSTDANGRFTCEAGQTVTFTIGGVTLGQAACSATVTPLELAGSTDLASAGVVNRLMFLQLLDEDDNPDNGIRIASGVVTAMQGKSLDFAAAGFDTALAALLPVAADSFGNPYNARVIDDKRKTLAVEFFESGLATHLASVETSLSTQTSAGGAVQITKYILQADSKDFIPFEGSNAAVKSDFPQGFYPAVGSGLAFKGKAADGALEFYGITDRGPNGDSPNAPTVADPTKSGITKMFPAPNFAPAIGLISVGKSGALLKSRSPLMVDATNKVSGRPLPVGSVGSSGETPLTENLKYEPTVLAFDANGLDTESLVYDAANKVFWTSDEYGPFIVKIDATNNRVLKKYAPGAGAADLPVVLASRRVNRGMEGLTMDSNGKLHGFLQSPIEPFVSGKSQEAVDASDMDKDGKNTDKVKLKDYAQFARWIEFDPVTETSRLYAYPIDGAMYDKNRTGNCKLGDVVALGSGKFLVIEQGTGTDGKVHNYLMLVEGVASATNIAAAGVELEANSIDGATVSSPAWSAVVTLKKKMLLDLNAAGWLAEKAEGLALVDANTIALINDNDFALRTVLTDAAGNFLDGDITACTVDANGAIVNDGNCAPGATGGRVTRGFDSERPTRLWLFKFPKNLTSYSAS